MNSPTRPLAKAFTHSSSVDNRLDSNERLEFLGDAILSIVICQKLFEKFERYREGELTKMKSMLVSRGTCASRPPARVAEVPGRGQGDGVAQGVSHLAGGGPAGGGDCGRLPRQRLRNGPRFHPAELRRRSSTQIDSEEAHGNYKSLLQQHAQEQFNTVPIYVLLDEKGPDHNKCFESEVVIDQRHFPRPGAPTRKRPSRRRRTTPWWNWGSFIRLRCRPG